MTLQMEKKIQLASQIVEKFATFGSSRNHFVAEHASVQTGPSRPAPAFVPPAAYVQGPSGRSNNSGSQSHHQGRQPNIPGPARLMASGSVRSLGRGNARNTAPSFGRGSIPGQAPLRIQHRGPPPAALRSTPGDSSLNSSCVT